MTLILSFVQGTKPSRTSTMCNVTIDFFLRKDRKHSTIHSFRNEKGCMFHKCLRVRSHFCPSSLLQCKLLLCYISFFTPIIFKECKRGNIWKRIKKVLRDLNQLYGRTILPLPLIRTYNVVRNLSQG